MTTVERPSNHDALISYRAAVNAISVDEKNISYTEQLGADMDTALMHYMDIQYDYENYL